MMPVQILLVEDNEMNRDMLSRRLARHGFLVQMAEDGQRGLEMAGAGDVAWDLILLDMSLPELDGWEVARRLKERPATAKIPIIALTAHAMSGDREKAIAAGCDDYDTKPIELVRLLQKIQQLVTPAPAAREEPAPAAREEPAPAAREEEVTHVERNG